MTRSTRIFFILCFLALTILWSNLLLAQEASLCSNIKILSWKEAGSNALPLALNSHTSLVFNNKMWAIGGKVNGTNVDPELGKKVFNSPDGINWNEVGNNALPVGLVDAASVNFNNKIWVLGGYITGSLEASVKAYNSFDGVNWTEVGEDVLPESLRNSATLFNNKIWGIANHPITNVFTLYSSTNGSSWVNNGTVPLNDYYFSLVSFQDKLWVTDRGVDGTAVPKLYNSSDGNIWKKVACSPLQITNFSIQELIPLNNKLFIIGRSTNSYNLPIRVFSSSNGINWTEESATGLPLKDLTGAAFVTFKNKIWELGGGNNNENPQKVFYSDVKCIGIGTSTTN